ncbi:MAG: hypothetical protein ACLPY5_08550 [Candidatus Bathyarchaeia archaeon]
MLSIVGEGRGPKFIEKCYRILLFLAYNGPTKKQHIILLIEPAIDKPTVYKALKQLHEERFITFRKSQRWSDRGVRSEISRKGLLELLRIYFRGPIASALRRQIFDLMDKSPDLRADQEWIATVQSLMPLIQKLTTTILSSGSTASQASNADMNKEYVLSMIWEDPQEALRKLIQWIEVVLLMEGRDKQVRAPAEAFDELQTILQKHPMYLKVTRKVMKREIARYGRMLRIKRAMQKFVATTPF